MIIAIDYDKTYTADPAIFDKVISLFIDAGHTVICVTGRSDGPMGQEVKDSIGKLVPVVFSHNLWKRMAAHKAGYEVDIWIDDMPEMIVRPDGGF